MDRKTETQLRQEIAEVWALLDAERAGRAALIRRIEQEEQSVPVEVSDSPCAEADGCPTEKSVLQRFWREAQSVAVVGEPIYWIDPDDDANLSRIGRVGWSPLYGESPAYIPAAELATLREKAAEADELRKDAERYRKLRGWMSSNVKEGWGRVTDLSAVFCYVSWQEGDSYLDNLPECNVGLMQKDAAIAQEGE